MPVVGAKKKPVPCTCSNCRIRFMWYLGKDLCWWCFHKQKDGIGTTVLKSKGKGK